MKTIQINNPELEQLISSQYGSDTESLLTDFTKFIKLSFDDGYPSISKEEASKRVHEAIKEVEIGSAKLLSEDEYERDINEFISSL